MCCGRQHGGLCGEGKVGPTLWWPPRFKPQTTRYVFPQDTAVVVVALLSEKPSANPQEATAQTEQALKQLNAAREAAIAGVWAVACGVDVVVSVK